MYANLGNRQAQADARDADPTSKHCDLLLVSANACTGCKHNPYESESAKRSIQSGVLVERYAAEINQAIKFGTYLIAAIQFSADESQWLDVELWTRIKRIHEAAETAKIKAESSQRPHG